MFEFALVIVEPLKGKDIVDQIELLPLKPEGVLDFKLDLDGYVPCRLHNFDFLYTLINVILRPFTIPFSCKINHPILPKLGAV